MTAVDLLKNCVFKLTFKQRLNYHFVTSQQNHHFIFYLVAPVLFHDDFVQSAKFQSMLQNTSR